MSRSRQLDKSKSVDVLFQQAQRAFLKLDYKQALKDARLLIRQDPTPNHRCFLERASVARAAELVRGGLRDQAQAVLEELLTESVTEAGAREQLPDLLLAVGWLDRYPQYKPQNDPDSQLKFLARGVDVALVRGQPAPAEMREGVELVRQAIARLEAGDAEPLAGLKEIPRHSPLADWRLFLRGFVAYSRDEIDEAQSAWERLEAERMPARIAKGLLAHRKPELLKEADYTVRGFVAGLEKLTSGSSVLHVLRMVQAAIARNEWSEALSLVGRQRGMLRAADPEILQRFTAIVLSKAIHSTDRELLRELARSSDPLPIDPAWNRAWALLYEGERSTDYADVERSWLAYKRDLETATGISEEERRLAQALALEHLAIEALDCHAYQDEIGCPEDGYVDEFEQSQADFRDNIFGILKESLKLAGLKSTYHVLVSVYEDEDNLPAMTRTYKELAAKYPDDLEAISWLSSNLPHGEEALVYAPQAVRQKPLDPLLKSNLWKALRNLARHRSREGDFKGAGAALEESAEHFPTEALPFSGLVLPFAGLVLDAILSLNEGRLAEAEALLSQAEKLAAPFPPALWLMLVVDAGLMGTTNFQMKRFVLAWQKSLKAKFSADTAVRVAGMIREYRRGRVSIVEKDERIGEFRGYLSRGLRSKFECNTLQQLLDHMHEVPELREEVLWSKYVAKAIKAYPESPLIVMMYVNEEVQKGPEKMKGPRTLLKLVNKCVVATEAGDNLEDKEHLPALETLQDMLHKLNIISRVGFNPGRLFDMFQ